MMAFGVSTFFNLTINQLDNEHYIKTTKHRVVFQVIYYVYTFIGMAFFSYGFWNATITGGIIALMVNVGKFDLINDKWFYAFKYGFVAATWIGVLGLTRWMPTMIMNSGKILWTPFWFAPFILMIVAFLMGIVAMVILNDNDEHGGLTICGIMFCAAMMLIRLYGNITAYNGGFTFGLFMYFIVFTAAFLGVGFLGLSLGFGLGQVVDDNT